MGSAEVLLEERRSTGALPLAVRCRFGSLAVDEVAMLDTGAQFTLMGPELSELLGEELGGGLQSATVSTRLGKFRGTLHRIPIRLVADTGVDLMVDATCLVLPQWEGPTILGFHGFLERLRFALDPGTRADIRPCLHFGSG